MAVCSAHFQAAYRTRARHESSSTIFQKLAVRGKAKQNWTCHVLTRPLFVDEEAHARRHCEGFG
jgi:hypothetical protein